MRDSYMMEAALEEAGDNAGEIKAFLKKYESDKEKSVMAAYTVAAMPGLYSDINEYADSIDGIYREMYLRASWGMDSLQDYNGKKFSSASLRREYDLRTLDAAYLSENLEDSYRMWKERRWNHNLPFDIFCETILPYRNGNEPVTHWRMPYRESLSNLEDSLKAAGNAVEAAFIVARHLGYCQYNMQFPGPHRSALSLLDIPMGYCREDCDRTLYAMRAMGIPVVIDMLPVSPDNGGSHSWAAVYDSESRLFRMFENEVYLPTRDSIHYDQRRKGKVYRFTFMPDASRLKLQNDAALPALLRDPRLKDVTSEYYGENRAEVETAAEGDVFLCVFTGSGLSPVDLGRRKGRKTIFRNMEPEVIFFPAARSKTGIMQCGHPFMVTRNGSTHSFIPEESERVRLTRKMPVRDYIRKRLDSLEGCIVQSAPTVSGPWRDLSVIMAPIKTNHIRVNLPDDFSDRFIRIVPPFDHVAMIAEVIASRDSLAQERISLSFANDKYKLLTDGDILSFEEISPEASDIVAGISGDGKPRYLFLSPRNDDNFVVPGEFYELLYADSGGWKSLGSRKAEDFHIDFNAPRNAVLLLRNLTKGHEEQVFIWKGGRQLFNLDLLGTTE